MTYGLLLDALGDQTRRSILDHLREGPQPVGVLAIRLPVSRPAVSQHLRVLRQAGLVSFTEAGTKHLYAINPAGPAQLREYADHLWDVTLKRFKEFAERGTTETTIPPAPRKPAAGPGAWPRGRGGRHGRRKR
jgi:DNA-binding transcriptional ArsR family regulator